MKYDEIEKFAQNNKVPIMMKDGIELLCQLIRENQIRDILELGTAIGYSAIKMAEIRKDICVTTLEIDEERYQQALINIREAHLEDQIHAVLMDAMLYETEKKFDLIFIDAAKSQTQRYLDHFAGNLKEEGIVVVDNLNFHGMVDDPSLTENRNTRQMIRKIKKFRDEIQVNEKYHVTFLKNVGDGIMIIKNGNK